MSLAHGKSSTAKLGVRSSFFGFHSPNNEGGEPADSLMEDCRAHFKHLKINYIDSLVIFIIKLMYK